MNFTYENQGTNTYLVYKIEEDDVLDTMSLGMLTNNKIPGLAPTFFMQMDMNKYIKYNVSAKISVNQFFEGAVNQKRLIGVFTGIVDAILSAEDYMIDENSILMDLDHIFADVTTCETVMICLPVMDTANSKVDMGAFFKNIMFSTRFDQTESCDYVAKIINYLNSTPIFSLVDFKALLETLKGNGGTEPVHTPVREQPTAFTGYPAPSGTGMQPSAPQAGMQPSASSVGSSAQKVQQSVYPGVQPSGNQSVQPSVQPTIQPAVQPRVTPVQTTPVYSGSSSSMAIPTATPAVTEQKKSGMFGFLKSSGKEDRDSKKQQKEAEKQQKEAEKQQKEAEKRQKEAEKKANKGKKSAPEPSMSFAIPGQKTPIAQPTVSPVADKPMKGGTNKTMAPGAHSQMNHGMPGIPQQTTQSGAVSSQQSALQSQVYQQQASQPVAQGYQQIYTPTYQQPAVPQGHAMNFGETTVLSSGKPGETTVLSAASAAVEIRPFLIRKKNNEKILLDKPVFRIGKEKSYVDYFISDNTAISRSHANLISRDGEYFIMDTNSTNHTYVGGNMIQSNVEVKLTHGMKLRLANEEFEFWLY